MQSTSIRLCASLLLNGRSLSRLPVRVAQSKTSLFSTALSLPHHMVVGMPALSPTMETGSIAAWKVSEGDSFQAGDSLAEIQTDKATMTFEAQDGGFVAKLLVKAGDGADIKIGTPIMVTVEEQEYVVAFQDFVLSSVPESRNDAIPAQEQNSKPSLPPATAPIVDTKPNTSRIPSHPKVEPIEIPTPTRVEIPVATALPSDVETVTTTTKQLHISPPWGHLARIVSPLAKTLSAEQKKYVETFGSTGQIPL